MAIKRNRLKPEQSTTPAAKPGTQILSTTKHTAADKSLKPEAVAGGREVTDKKEVKEARNASMKGYIVNSNGGDNTKNKSTSSTSKPIKKSPAPVSKNDTNAKGTTKPTVEQVKKKAKPKPDAMDLYYRSPEYKAQKERAQIKSEYLRDGEEGFTSSVSLRDMIYEPVAEEATRRDPRLREIAKRYGVDLSLLTDIDGDGDIDEDDVQLITEGEQNK